jgi:hypothetical protein
VQFRYVYRKLAARDELNYSDIRTFARSLVNTRIYTAPGSMPASLPCTITQACSSLTLPGNITTGKPGKRGWSNEEHTTEQPGKICPAMRGVRNASPELDI